MGVLLPAALALLALAIPIVIFYMLRLRREELPVSSSLLWRRALQDRTANAPWQRLKRNLLLLLQLLLLALLVVSLARPFLNVGTVAASNVVLILDASASMQATDEANGESRFERARQEASALVDALQGGSRMSIVLAGPHPAVIASASDDKSALRATLGGLAPSNGGTDMVQAITLASAASRQLGDATVVLISDGALAQSGQLPQATGRAAYINVGKSGRNLAITSLSLRDGPGGPQLFAGIYNSASQPAAAILAVKVDGQLRDSRTVDLGAGDEKSVTLEGLPLTTRLVEATISVDGADANLLAADDTAWAVRATPPDVKVLLVTRSNSFLEKSLSLVPNVKLFKSAPADYASSNDYDLTVLDASMPAQVPGGNLLLFAPPNSPLLPVSGTLSYPAVGQAAVNDPLMRFVDLSNLHLAIAQRMGTPSWARVLLRTTSGEPLMIAGETGGRRVAAIAFDLHQSDLPLQVAFPILMANLVQWLQPTGAVDAPAVLGADDPISINPAPQADQIVVTPPGSDAKSTTLQPSGPASFAGTDRLGLYTVQQMFGGKPLGPPEQFAVNLFSREEANITPRTQIAFSGSAPSPGAGTAQRPVEIWPWALLASLLLLTLEWWLYNRAGLPRIRWPRHTATRPK